VDRTTGQLFFKCLPVGARALEPRNLVQIVGMEIPLRSGMRAVDRVEKLIDVGPVVTRNVAGRGPC
jgi:hypothetical protein